MSAKSQQDDLAGQDHWDKVYALHQGAPSGWRPRTYDDLVLQEILMGELRSLSPTSILEVGCGDSKWLPYLAQKTGARPAGIDYSPRGCDLARSNLEKEGVSGTIYCADLFTLDPAGTGQFDFVYSLGVIEHFSDLEGVLRKLVGFVRPGGILLAEVPNLAGSFHGFLSWFWQPEIFYQHNPVTLKGLKDTFESVGLQSVHGRGMGFFSLNIPAYELSHRYAWLKRITPPVRKIQRLSDKVLRRMHIFRGIRFFAPFLYAAGRKAG